MLLPSASIIALKGQMNFHLTKWINRYVAAIGTASPNICTDPWFRGRGQNAERTGWLCIRNWVEFRMHGAGGSRGEGANWAEQWVRGWVLRRNDQWKTNKGSGSFPAGASRDFYKPQCHCLPVLFSELSAELCHSFKNHKGKLSFSNFRFQNTRMC